MPGGTPLLAGIAVGAYGLTQAMLQIPFGVWSDRIGRKPLIVVGLLLHVAGSVLGAVAASAPALVVARIVQGLGAVSGPVMAFLADLTRPESRTRAMFTIGMSIGVSFVISLVAGPLLAAAIGVSGVFLLIGGLGLVALALVLFVLPAEQPLRRRPGARAIQAGPDGEAPAALRRHFHAAPDADVAPSSPCRMCSATCTASRPRATGSCTSASLRPPSC